PVSLTVYLTRTYLDPGRDREQWRRTLLATAGLAALAASAIAAFTLRRVFVSDYFRGHDYRPLDWGRFLTGYGRFLLGLSLAPHEPPLRQGWISPAAPAVVLQQETLFWVAVAVALLFGGRRLILGRQWLPLSLVAGTLLGLTGFHAVAGSQVLMSG